MEQFESSSAIPPVISAAPAQRAPMLYAIIFFKFVKGGLLLMAAAVVFQLAGVNLQHQFNRMLQDASLDPNSPIFMDVGQWLHSLTPGNVRLFATGTVFYSIFSFVEGTGLFLRAGWAGWMAIGESACFVPVEVYQYLGSYSTTVLVILILNILIVWYLYTNRKRLFHHHHRWAH